MARPQNLPPKPFFWIPVERKPDRQAPVPHDRFAGLSGWLALDIEVLSRYLYVGSGQIELRNHQGQEVACYTFARRDEQLVIPGTSIKGAIRSVVEAISNSCVKVSIKSERISRSHNPCSNANSLCPACRIFGTTGYRGRVHFADAVPLGKVRPAIIKIADLWPPRQARGRKFYRSKQFQELDQRPARNHRFLEAVPQGSKFRTVLRFENASPAEMGLLVRALGLDRPSEDPSGIADALPIKLGGAKPRCLGSVRFTPKDLWLIPEGPQFLTSLAEGGVKVSTMETLLRWSEDDALLDRDAYKHFRREAQTVEEFCPRGVY